MGGDEPTEFEVVKAGRRAAHLALRGRIFSEVTRSRSCSVRNCGGSPCSISGWFELGSADRADLTGYYQVVVGCQEFDRPDEPRLTYENVIGRPATPFPGLGPAVHWVARGVDGLLGVAKVHFQEAENAHVAVAEVQVRPASRRRGVGTALLAAIASLCRSRGRRVAGRGREPR
ncbi:GNAT family N-acetyltransferase [Saccharothrix espanaensis]|nr:GNAT family N-acetyltransferase [Saccharothrix espanaensis]